MPNARRVSDSASTYFSNAAAESASSRATTPRRDPKFPPSSCGSA
jgi:hypothetical protein